MTALLAVSDDEPAPSTVITVTGSGFADKRTRLLLDGVVTGAVMCEVVAGAFSRDIRVGATAGPQTISAEQYVSGTWTEIDDIDVTVTVPIPDDSLPGWVLAFSDDFSTWDDSNYFVYPDGWTNNYTGYYDPTIISSDGSKLRIHIHTRDGHPRIAAFCPIPTGSLSARGDLLGMRYEFRIRADFMVGYKGVPLLWPMSGIWPQDGEIDWPESSFNAQPAGFMHRQDATSGSDQDYWSSTAGTNWNDWHNYALEWDPGVSMKAYQDGVLLKTVTSRVPDTALHLVMQFETNLTMTVPSPAIEGYVEIDFLKVWTPA